MKPFFTAITQYVVDNTYKIASGNDFFSAIRNHSDADFSALLRQYFENPPSF